MGAAVQEMAQEADSMLQICAKEGFERSSVTWLTQALDKRTSGFLALRDSTASHDSFGLQRRERRRTLGATT